MCDCYAHKCECCDETIPMHIQDFDYPRWDFRCWCEKHIHKAAVGAVVFTLEEKLDWEGADEEPDVGWKCAIKGPAVGEVSGNTPNLASPMTETVVTVRRWVRVRLKRICGR